MSPYCFICTAARVRLACSCLSIFVEDESCVQIWSWRGLTKKRSPSKRPPQPARPSCPSLLRHAYGCRSKPGCASGRNMQVSDRDNTADAVREVARAELPRSPSVVQAAAVFGTCVEDLFNINFRAFMRSPLPFVYLSPTPSSVSNDPPARLSVCLFVSAAAGVLQPGMQFFQQRSPPPQAKGAREGRRSGKAEHARETTFVTPTRDAAVATGPRR